MKKLFHISMVIAAILLSSCTIFRNYKDITKKPAPLYENYALDVQESNINLAIKADLSMLEGEINAALNNDFSGEGDGNVEYKRWIKIENPLYHPNEWILTKDPLYHPNKWFETKDPLYNPKKWIRVGPVKTKNPLYHPNKWIKTKDPLYHPNEWIKTKDPLYNPTEWIETKGPAISVGYRYDYTIKKKAPITLTALENNTLKISVPIKFDGTVGLQGDAAQLLTLDRKNFEGEVEFFVDVNISVDSTWCPVVTTLITHHWLSKPTVEIMNDINVSVTGLVDSYLQPFEKKINQELQKKIDCNMIKGEVAKYWMHYEFQLPPLPDGKQYYVNVNPQKPSMSKLLVSKDTLALQIGLTCRVSVEENVLNTTPPLPSLGEAISSDGNVSARIPLFLKYTDIENNINNHLKDNNIVIGAKILKRKPALAIIREVRVFPYGDELIVGVNVKTKHLGNIFPAVGWVYVKGKPLVRDGSILELDSVDFTINVDNKLYPAVSSVLRQAILAKLKTATRYDISDKLNSGTTAIAEKLKSLNNHNLVDFSAKNIRIGIYDIEILKDEIAIISELNSDVDISIKKRPSLGGTN